MKSNIEIRAYRPDDEVRLLAIWRAASLLGHPFFDSAQLDADAITVRDIYLPKAENWVACVDGEPMGFIGLLDNFIGGLFVDPAAHGEGLGRALVDHAQILKGHLELEVFARNLLARGFYERLGFDEVSRRFDEPHGFPLELIKLRRGYDG
jgi:ribosomal protein S18 acetylase RimI-like enzyme